MPEGGEVRLETDCERRKKKTGSHFTTTPSFNLHYLSVSHPFLSSKTHTHILCPLVHSLPQIPQQESLGKRGIWEILENICPEFLNKVEIGLLGGGGYMLNLQL